MSLRKKLTLTSIATVLVLIALAATALYTASKLGSEIATSTGPVAQRLSIAGNMKAAANNIRSNQRGYVMYAMQHDRKEQQAKWQDYLQTYKEMDELIAKMQTLMAGDGNAALLDLIESASKDYDQYFQQIKALVEAGKTNEAFAIVRGKAAATGEVMEGSANDMMELQMSLMDESSATGRRASVIVRWLSLVMIAIGFVVSGIIIVVITRGMRSLEQMMQSLADSSGQISAASSQVSEASQALAQGASEQAASLEETSAASEELTSMTRKNADNSQTAAQVMSEVDSKITEGNGALQEMIASMNEITSSSDKISKIIKVIDEIAFQTNILALNAAVEAARAGEAGMGFAVVADEVRNLAQRSAQAAKDTASLIEDSIGKSNAGGAKLAQVSEVIRSITDSAAKVKTLVDEVSLASQEQSRGIAGISKSIVEMERVTQSNAASAEQSASASQELSAQANSLNQIVADLGAMVGASR